MKSLEQFENLARAARAEPVPAIDVTARVMSRLRSGVRPRRWEDLPLWVMAGISALAAAVMVSVVLDEWLPMLDPLAGLFQPLTLVLL